MAVVPQGSVDGECVTWEGDGKAPQMGVEDLYHRPPQLSRHPFWLRVLIGSCIDSEPVDEKAWSLLESGYKHLKNQY